MVKCSFNLFINLAIKDKLAHSFGALLCMVIELPHMESLLNLKNKFKN
jgi:hypothetical protein